MEPHKKISTDKVHEAFEAMFAASPAAKHAKKGDAIHTLMMGSYMAGYVGGMEMSAKTLEDVNRMLGELNDAITPKKK